MKGIITTTGVRGSHVTQQHQAALTSFGVQENNAYNIRPNIPVQKIQSHSRYTKPSYRAHEHFYSLK